MRAKPILNTLAICGLALALAACGSSRFERGASGAGIGGLAGAGVVAAAGGPILAGAAVGALGGAAVGALTSECDIDLGPQRPNRC
ncbi:hypothetical protein GR183_00970 [Stappia sp. GBMRC 2046]|uniref:Uncharacterized protein n=1 Tax=Stappia sediminis TaxID=2692190 RepID=A0A7X3LQX9_9HYPH|nr:hypothetical protein [Stappia sediminis]MXN63462.1 hypothetical protein [Stappia sediminis]